MFTPLWGGGYVVAKTTPKIGVKMPKFAWQCDYVRWGTLALIAEEINEKKIDGCIAECGVYKGLFAKGINFFFPNRKFYLFDTFEGFDQKDIDIDRKGKYSTANIGDFSDTSIDVVMQKMLHPENCIIKKGFFPESAKDVNEKFVFVSLDMDLYKPIYDGLCYFYPRLQQGGYIFVHDYNNDYYSGAKDAVKKFINEHGNTIPYFPLCDAYGTLVVMK
jgi:O-methyltransferase